MDIKQILKEKIEGAKNEEKSLMEGKSLQQLKRNRALAVIMGMIDAYNDSLTAIEQSEKPMKVKLDYDVDTPFPVGHHICPKCGMDLELYVDGSDKDMWKEDCHFCPKCACPLDWGEGESK